MESLRPEEIEYLRFKGCFSLPPRELREALVKAYFHHAHPFEPVLDPEDFFNKYTKGDLSLLLLWSMFVSAASVCSLVLTIGNSNNSHSSSMISCLRKASMTRSLRLSEQHISEPRCV